MRSKVICLIIVLVSVKTWSQKASTSPFSSYGLGEFGTLEHASFSGIGNISCPLSDSLNLNFNNPASYSFLGTGQPIFSTGVSSRFSTFEENGTSEKSHLTGINHFAMGLSFGKRLGFAFGVKPFTRKGYEFYEKTLVNTDSIRYTYKGQGSTNQAFVGFSIKVLTRKKHKLSIGSNINYAFGNVSDKRIANLTALESGGLEERVYQVKSLTYDLGISYIFRMAHNRFLNVGLAYIPKQKLIASKTTNLVYAFNVENENSYVSLSYLTEKGNIYFPSTLTSGLSYTLRPKIDSSYNKTKIPQVVFYTQFSTTSWTTYRTDFASDNKPNYLNSYQVAFGAEFSPHFNYLDRSKAINYLNRIRYKIGYQYATLPVQYLTEQVKSHTYSVGFSFPILSQRSASSLNVGLTYGKRGTFSTSSLNEKFVGFNIGVNITPGSYDRWFRKYKID